MYKILAGIIVIILLFHFSCISVIAEEKVAGISAVPKFKALSEAKFDYREYVLRKFLRFYNSPLVPYSPVFIRTADFYGLDWRILPAISGVESTFGKFIPFNSFNAYGWARGDYQFSSWPDSIQIVNKSLKENYINKGFVSISTIARIYSPPSFTWGGNVKFFIQKLTPLPLSFDI